MRQWWLTCLLQNAMNAAEITDKLGLHSLRQRAWVRCSFLPLGGPPPDSHYSTSSRLALPRVTVCTKVLSG